MEMCCLSIKVKKGRWLHEGADLIDVLGGLVWDSDITFSDKREIMNGVCLKFVHLNALG